MDVTFMGEGESCVVETWSREEAHISSCRRLIAVSAGAV
jgi:hypothetical protein